MFCENSLAKSIGTNKYLLTAPEVYDLMDADAKDKCICLGENYLYSGTVHNGQVLLQLS